MVKLALGYVIENAKEKETMSSWTRSVSVRKKKKKSENEVNWKIELVILYDFISF